jgi:hypothetical protein
VDGPFYQPLAPQGGQAEHGEIGQDLAYRAWERYRILRDKQHPHQRELRNQGAQTSQLYALSFPICKLGS